MTDHDLIMAPDDVQVLENVLDDSKIDGVTRRSLLGRAAAGTAAAAAAGTFFGGAGTALAQGSGDSASDILNAAITAEELAVTYVSGLIQNASKTGVTKFVPILKAVNESEYEHYTALKSLGAKPITSKFWVPDVAFKKGKVFPLIEQLETLFVNAYLIGTTAFAKASMTSPTRYTQEILGVEAQHRVLARFAQGKMPPNNVGFEGYQIKQIGDIVGAIEKLGVGFGKKGSASPGKFYTFPGKPPSGTTTKITHTMPQ
jgi:hypothetical protein